MNDLNRALGDISSIRRQMARSTEFRGYGPATLAATGLIAVLAAGIQAMVLPDPAAHISTYLSIWICTAGLSAALTGIQMYTRTRRMHSGMSQEMMHMAVEQFLPSVGSGTVDYCCAGAICSSGSLDDPRDLAGHFQPGRIFFVPLSTPANACGGSVVPADGPVLYLARRQPSAFPMGHGHSVWRRTVAGRSDSALQRARGYR